MGLYNFKRQFAPHILSGRKQHTIRAKRKHPDVPGNPFHGYVGLRTKKAERIVTSRVTKVEDIRIAENSGRGGRANVWIGDTLLANDECEALAYADGFDSFADMMKFWDGRLPFSGDLIHFRSPQRERVEGSREIQDLLALVGCVVPQLIIRKWTEDQKKLATKWAAKSYLRASDNPVRVPPRPAFLNRFMNRRAA